MNPLIVLLVVGWVFSSAGCSASSSQSQITPPGGTPAPPASAGHSLVYATDLEMVLLVNAGLGGATNVPAASTLTRVWGWTGAEWSLLDSAGPPVRNLAGVAYDTRRHTLVMHGGTYDLGHSYGETWEWTRLAGWRRFAGTGPGIRDHTQMAYDAERGKAVLFGGSDNPNAAFSDTWEFDGARWERVATTGPPARVHHAMQYDPDLRRVVLFGGFTPGGADLGDSWTWDGSRWTPLTQPTSPRTHARMAFHRRLNTLLVLGGLTQGSTGLGMLALRAAGWTAVTALPEPTARYLPDAAYDEKRDLLVLFGGGDPNGTALYADTWEFDGTTWRRIRDR